jgi:DNA replication protein DnaC
MKMGHLASQLDTVCEQAAKRELAYKEFLTEALGTEWTGRHLKGVEARLAMARFPWIKTLDQFDFTFQPSLDRKVVRELAGLKLRRAG